MSIPSDNPSQAGIQTSGYHELRDHGFELLHRELRFLMDAYAGTLERLGEGKLAEALPWLEDAGDKGLQTDHLSGRSLGQAYSIAFQLLNVVEERVAAQVRRLREKELGASSEKGLWAENLRLLVKEGFSREELLEVFKTVLVEPVLTAHPTEAKRETVRERHREIYSLMNRHENVALTPREQERLRRQIMVELESLWRTGEIHVTRPSIEAELQNALHYLREVFPEALNRAQVHLSEAWVAEGFDEAELSAVPPMIRFGTWIGGDRDGHPFVTADVTQRALKELRRNALRVQRRGVERLGYHLPLSQLFQEVPPELIALRDRLRAELAAVTEVDVSYIHERNREEPWREVLFLMRAKLVVAGKNPGAPGGYLRAEELLQDLDAVAAALEAVGSAALVQEWVRPVQRQVMAFGFHSAVLDVRQNSAFHEKALSQLMQVAGVEGAADFAQWTQEQKRALLEAELASPRPFLVADQSAGAEADAVLQCFRVLKQHLQDYGQEGLGALIVSMTRSVEDLLVVYLLAREAGLAVWTEAGLVCPLQVAPLFETMADLAAGPGIVKAFLAHPVTQRSLALSGEEPCFQMMVGYSDSNKDCGIFASQWGIHKAQQELAAEVKSAGLRPVFFHGRGGTVGRGAGPTHWFMEAMPPGALSGTMRMTEQGETIAQKYAHMNSAVYNLELLMASAAATTARHRRAEETRGALDDVAERLASWSTKAYRELLEAEGFITFYRQATPIDALEHSRIGSRPARRTGQPTLSDLRAIPWVFSWTQSRFYLPGWYGVGSALERLQKESPDEWQLLSDSLKGHAFLRYVLTNVESSLVSVNADLMQTYAGLVEDTELRERFMSRIMQELETTQSMLELLFKKSFAVRRPRLAFTLGLREQPLEVLHRQQVELVKRWRACLKAEDAKGAEVLIPDLLVSINALASGLRTTG